MNILEKHKKSHPSCSRSSDSHVEEESFRINYYYQPTLRRTRREIPQIETVEPSGVHVLKNPNPLKDVEASALLDVAVLV